MNGVHDMGGMHGFGPVVREENEPVFHEAWEGRLYAMRRLLRTGPMRPAIERLDPAVYLSVSYYERWLRSTLDTLVAGGVLTREELDAKAALFADEPGATVPVRDDPEMKARAAGSIMAIQWPRRDVGIEPAFAVGDGVRVRNIHPTGHTRLPRYARGKRGVVALYHGVHDFQDEAPAALAGPQPVYNVRFDAAELWGEQAEANQSVFIDMWESYLDPV